MPAGYSVALPDDGISVGETYSAQVTNVGDWEYSGQACSKLKHGLKLRPYEPLLRTQHHFLCKNRRTHQFTARTLPPKHPYPFRKLCQVHYELGLSSRNDGAVERHSWELVGEKLKSLS